MSKSPLMTPKNQGNAAEEESLRELRDTEHRIQIEKLFPDQSKLRSLEMNCIEYFCLLLCNLPLLFILPFTCGFYTVQPMESVVLMFMGKILKVENATGLHWTWLGVSRIGVPLSVKTLEIKNSKVPDSTGAPLAISTIINYRITDPVKSLFYVQNYENFLMNQALDVIQNVICKFPYRSNDAQARSLMSHRSHIGQQMKGILQMKIEISGLEVINTDIMEVYYHPSVAQTLLQIQQAQSKLDARKIIVEGSVKITQDMLDSMAKDHKIEFSDENKQKFVKDMLLILCSDHGHAQPVINL